MTLRLWRIQLYIGPKRDQPITYDDLLDAETRAFDAEERLAEIAGRATQTGRYSRRLDADLDAICHIAATQPQEGEKRG